MDPIFILRYLSFFRATIATIIRIYLNSRMHYLKVIM
jgi:hypothetical protein